MGTLPQKKITVPVLYNFRNYLTEPLLSALKAAAVATSPAHLCWDFAAGLDTFFLGFSCKATRGNSALFIRSAASFEVCLRLKLWWCACGQKLQLWLCSCSSWHSLSQLKASVSTFLETPHHHQTNIYDSIIGSTFMLFREIFIKLQLIRISLYDLVAVAFRKRKKHSRPCEKNPV